MFGLLLLLLILFVLWPIVRFLYAIWKVRSSYNATVNEARQAAREAEAASRPAGWSAPRAQKSKIYSPSEGEYVEWEEVSASETETTTDPDGNTTTRHTSTTYTSERITDADWEDL